MKYLVVLAVVCAGIGLSEVKKLFLQKIQAFQMRFFFLELQQGLSREEFEGMIDNFLADCGAKEGASADDIKHLKDRNLPTTKGQMCVAACVGENLGFVSKK